MRTLIALLAALTLASCTVPRALNGVVTDETRHFEPALVGTWLSAFEDDEVHRLVITEEDGGYRLALEEFGKPPALLRAELTLIGGAVIADVTLHEQHLGESVAELFVVPVHQFARVDLRGDELALGFAIGDEKVIDAAVRRGTHVDAATGTRRSKPEPLLAGQAAELRATLARWLEDGTISEPELVYRRVD